MKIQGAASRRLSCLGSCLWRRFLRLLLQERTLAEDLLHELPLLGARVDGEDADVDPVPAHVGDHVAEPRDLVGKDLEVGDDEDRALLRARVDERRVRLGETGRDARARPEVLPRVGREAAGRAVRVGPEEAEERQKLAAGRPRRQHLVRRVREDDEPGALALPRHLLKRRAERRLVDARREVEHDDARRARGHERRVAHVGAAGGEEREHERGDERERQCDADDRRPPDDAAQLARSRPTGTRAQASPWRSFTSVRIRAVSPVEGDGGDQAATRVSSAEPVRLHDVELGGESLERCTALGAVLAPATTRRARWRARAAVGSGSGSGGGGRRRSRHQRRSNVAGNTSKAAASSRRMRPSVVGRDALRDRRQRRDVAAEGKAVDLRHVLRVDARDRLDRAEPCTVRRSRGFSAPGSVYCTCAGWNRNVRGAAPPGFWIVPSVDGDAGALEAAQPKPVADLVPGRRPRGDATSIASIGSYGSKNVFRLSLDGSSFVRSTTTSTSAVTVSPKRWMGGESDPLADTKLPAGRAGISSSPPPQPAASGDERGAARAALASRPAPRQQSAGRPRRGTRRRRRGARATTTTTGSIASPWNSRTSSRKRVSFSSRRSAASCSRSAASETWPVGGVRERHRRAAHVGEALLPDRVLDDHRHDLEPALERQQPVVAARPLEEVGDDEDERAGRQVSALRNEMVQAAGERVRRAPRTAAPGLRSPSSCGCAADARTARRSPSSR